MLARCAPSAMVSSAPKSSGPANLALSVLLIADTVRVPFTSRNGTETNPSTIEPAQLSAQPTTFCRPQFRCLFHHRAGNNPHNATHRGAA
jgi:hypothetical protein